MSKPTQSRPKQAEVQAGGFYVNDGKGIVREVFDELESGNVHWRSYYLQTGEPTGDSSVCSRLRICTWANRVATDEEIERMNIEYGHLAHVAQAQDLTEKLIRMIPDGDLLEEVRRRGLTI